MTDDSNKETKVFQKLSCVSGDFLIDSVRATVIVICRVCHRGESSDIPATDRIKLSFAHSDGEPPGTKSFSCPKCGQQGSLVYKIKRNKPAHITGFEYNIERKHSNKNESHHIFLRGVTTYILLRAIQDLVKSGVIVKGVDIYTIGATVNMETTANDGMVGAHQRLAEFVVGGKTLWQYNEIPNFRNAMTYCLGVVSSLPPEWNDADYLIEANIRGPLTKLAHRVVHDSIEKRESMGLRHFRKYLWFELLRIFYEASVIARSSSSGRLRSILTEYVVFLEYLKSTEAPGLVFSDCQQLYRGCIGGMKRIG